MMELGLYTLSDLITEPKTGIRMNAHGSPPRCVNCLS